MAKFIELHIASTGSAVIINLDYVEEIRECENGRTTVYLAYNSPDCAEQEYIHTKESYLEICCRMMGAGAL